ARRVGRRTRPPAPRGPDRRGMGGRGPAAVRRRRPPPAAGHGRPPLRRARAPLGALPAAVRVPARTGRTVRRAGRAGGPGWNPGSRACLEILLVKNLPPRTAALRPVLNASHYSWLALGVFVLTVYGSLIPLHYQPRPLAEAWAAFQGMTLFDPSSMEPRADWVISTWLYAVLSFAMMAALCVDRPWVVGLGAA